jgi:hypothetical protein
MALGPHDARVRAAINLAFVESGGAPPRIDDLATRVEMTRDAVFDALRRLEIQGSIILRPGTLDVWAAPPFSATPTQFRVHCDGARYWAGCAWCALGVCALLGAPGTITSNLGGEDDAVTIEVGPTGPTSARPLWVHFAVPAVRWEESLGYACATMMLFDDPEAIDAWSDRHRLPRGIAVPLEQTWRLAKGWFGGGLRPEPHARHRAELQAVFAGVGLDDPFFALKPREL